MRQEQGQAAKRISTSQPITRLLFIDNIRWTMILLVISMHAADTYSPFGHWYFADRKPLSMPVLLFFAVWQTYLQSFFMGLLFFVAGYFVPSSVDRKGPLQFLCDRGFRLGLPVLFYMLLLGPITEYFFAHSWTSTQPTSFAEEWWKHIQNGQVLQENGPLWFCLALLIFSLAYVVWRCLNGTQLAFAPASQYLFPKVFALLTFALILAVSTFFLRALHPDSYLNLPLDDFAQYILLFGAGVAAYRRHWLTQLRYRWGMRFLIVALSLGFPVWLLLLVASGALNGKAATFLEGWHWGTAAFAGWQSLTCVAFSYGLLSLFREKFNRQNSFARFLSQNAFSVYVFHPPVLIFFAHLMQGLVWQPILKFALLTTLTASVSFCLSGLVLRRIPFLRRIL